jgi:hypothetical protein
VLDKFKCIWLAPIFIVVEFQNKPWNQEFKCSNKIIFFAKTFDILRDRGNKTFACRTSRIKEYKSNALLQRINCAAIGTYIVHTRVTINLFNICQNLEKIYSYYLWIPCTYLPTWHRCIFQV